MTLYCVRIAVVCCLFYVYNDPMLHHRLSSSMPVKSETDTGIIINYDCFADHWPREKKRTERYA